MLGFVALAKIALADDAAEQNYVLAVDHGAFSATGQAANLTYQAVEAVDAVGSSPPPKIHFHILIIWSPYDCYIV